jgi:4-hydroxy-3-methylbut-2-enyl diphosphate reductase IspH
VQFIEKLGDNTKNFDTVKDGDVVILPAFGASYEEMALFDKKVSNRHRIPHSPTAPKGACTL